MKTLIKVLLDYLFVRVLLGLRRFRDLVEKSTSYFSRRGVEEKFVFAKSRVAIL